MSEEIRLEVKELRKSFVSSKKTVKAVDGVSFRIEKGKTLGVVGESGCGKTTLGRLIAGLLKPDSGEIIGPQNENKTARQIIFQDPYNSVDPYWTVEKIIAEAGISKKEVPEYLALVGLGEEEKNRYPHELSGGQLQRIGIARALASRADFLVCDEPVSALDVSYQSKIISLLEDLQAEKNMTYFFISHDLAVVRHIADDILIMYRGKIVEMAKTEEIIANGLHPYTRFLLSAVPTPFEKKEALIVREEKENSEGCVFAHRCPFATEKCMKQEPELKEIKKGRFLACHQR